MSNRPELWTYYNRGQGLHRGDELQPWRRRLAFTTVARPSSVADPSDPTPKIAAELNAVDQLFLPRPRQGRGSGDTGGEVERQGKRRDRGNGEVGGRAEMETKTGGFSCKLAIASPNDTWRGGLVNRWSARGVPARYGEQ